MHLLQVFGNPHVATAVASGLRRLCRARLKVGKVLRYQLHHPGVLHRAGCNEHHTRRAIVRIHVCFQVFAAEVRYRVFVAENRPTHWLIRKCYGLQMIENDVIRRVACLPDLLKHDLSLPLQFRLIKGGMGEDVRQNVDRQRNVGLQRPHVKSRLLTARVGVHVPADGLNFFGDLPRGAPMRSFESHVLEHVRHAHHGLRLVATAHVHPHA